MHKIRQFQCVPTTYVTEIKETNFEIYTKQVSYPLALPLLNISMFYVLLYVTLCPFQFCNHLDGEERAGCFALCVCLI